MKPAKLPKREQERLRQLHELGILDTLEEQAYDDLTRLAAVICDKPIALVSLIDSQRQWFKSHHGLEVRETPRELAFCAHAILQPDLFVVEDAYRDDRFYDNPLVTGPPNVRFYAGAPLVIESGLALGTLCVIGHEPDALTTEQARALEALARQVASQLELRLKVRELERLDRAKDEFTSMVSHELRTPLTALSGSLSLLRHGRVGQLDPASRQLVELAQRNAERLLILVNDILDVTKMEAGRLEMQSQPLDLVALVQKAVELNQAYLDRCGCRVLLELAAGTEPVTIRGDESRLLQVLTNLLSNAAKFSAGHETIAMRLSRADRFARIEVTNHGPGIPEADQVLVFRKYQQIDSGGHQKLPGTGLGLHISKQIVELHHGELTFESHPDDYTTFRVDLPLPNA